MIVRLALKLGAALATGVALSSCDVVGQLPLVQPDPIAFGSGTAAKMLTASITRNGSPIDPESYVVTCDVSLQMTPRIATSVTTIAAAPGSGSRWTCAIPQDLDGRIRRNQQIHVQWLVMAGTRKAAESELQTVLLDCANQRAALSAAQTAVTGGSFSASMRYDQIITLGYLPTHGPVSTQGMGVAFARVPGPPGGGPGALAAALGSAAVPVMNRPNMLLFAPSSNAASVTDQIPDDPYTLIGWVYGQAVDGEFAKPMPPSGQPDQGDENPLQARPSLRCVPHHEWFFHRSGTHRADGTFAGSPKPEFNPMASGIFHPDVWDLHFFVGADGVPLLAISHPTMSVPGNPPAANDFYYPTDYD